MPSVPYVARRPGPFSALVQAAEIGGLRLTPLPPARVRDRFYDTDDGELLRRGLVLRVRERGASRTAALRSLDGETAGLPGDVALAGSAEGDGPLALPPGPLRTALATLAGDDALRPLLSLRQYRTPRVAHAGAETVGVVSFDVVVYDLPGARLVSNEVEVDSTGDGAALAPLDAAFREHGLEPVPHSKFERGVLRMRRPLSEPALVIPSERAALEAAAESDDARLARAAQAVLLDTRGFRPDTIATQTGLSMEAVRQLRERFREVRLDVLDESAAPPEAPHRPATPPAAPRPAEPSAEVKAPRPASEPAPAGGDGLADAAESLADLLDLFAPDTTDTPLFGEADDGPELDGPLADGPDADDLGADGDEPHEEPPAEPSDAAPPAAPTPPTRTAPRRPRYPVVLGPVAADAPRDDSDAFADVDLGALGAPRPAPRPEPPAEPVEAPPSDSEWSDGGANGVPEPADRPPAPLAEPAAPLADAASDVSRPAFDGATPLLQAARASVAFEVAAFEAAAARFLGARKPSDARRLLVVAHRLRVAVETFRSALPEPSSRRLVAALRPLVADLDAVLDYGRAAVTAAGARPDLARRAADALDDAAARLDRQRDWGARARRLLDRAAAEIADGHARSDDAPSPPDDFVGPPGQAPGPTRVRHVLGSALWSRFEAVRQLEDALAEPSPELAQRLAVALGGLRFVVDLAGFEASPARLSGALSEAERAVAAARQRALARALIGGDGGGDDLGPVVQAWHAATDRPLRAELAAVAAAI